MGGCGSRRVDAEGPQPKRSCQGPGRRVGRSVCLAVHRDRLDGLAPSMGMSMSMSMMVGKSAKLCEGDGYHSARDSDATPAMT